MFDANFYRTTYPDLINHSDSQCWEHYSTYGWRERRRPHPSINVNSYLSRYTDLRAAFKGNHWLAYNHIFNFGIQEGRNYGGPNLNPFSYLYSSITGCGIVNPTEMLYRIGKAPGTLTGQGVTVGVIDTGLDLSHPDIPLLFFNTKELLNGKDDDNNGYVDDIYGVDIFSNDGIPEDLHGHGTLVTGVIKQVAPECLISPIKIAGESGASNDVYISNGIHYAINRGVKIINLSTSLLGPSNRVYQALQRAEQAGIVVLIGAGNTGESVPSFPARYADSIHNIIVVGSYGANGISNFSNKSGGVYPYVLAPGEYVISTTLGGGTGYCQGTSFACAHVTGLIAQLLQTIPNLSIAGIKDILMMSSGNFL